MEQPRERAVVVTVGHEELEHGRVRAELREDGQLSVTRVEQGRDAHFEGRLEGKRAEELMSRVASVRRAQYDSERGRHTPVPDETRYEIELHAPGEEPVTMYVWAGELDRERELGALVRELDAEVRRATEGQALL